MIKQFDKTNLKQVRADLDAMFKEFSKKHGVEMSIKNISFTGTTFSTKLEAKIIGAKTLDDTILESVMDARGLKKVGMGGRVLVGYNSRRHAYPFSFTADGKQFKCSEITAKMYFSK